MANTYIDFSVDNVNKTSKDDYKIEHIPRITEVILPNRNVASIWKNVADNVQNIITKKKN